eukprot:c27580_g1_i1 orf=122-1624(+)
MPSDKENLLSNSGNRTDSDGCFSDCGESATSSPGGVEEGSVTMEGGNGEDRSDEQPRNAVREEEERMGRLMRQNDGFVNEIKELRILKGRMEEEVTRLGEELETSNSRTEALIMEKNWLEDEKRKFELEACDVAKEAASLSQQKIELLAQKQSVLDEKIILEASLLESSGRIDEIAKELFEIQLVAAASQNEANALKMEIEQLSNERNKLYEAKDRLQAQNSDRESDIIQLQSQINALEGQLTRLVDSHSSLTELQINDANKVIEGLRAQVSSLQENKERLTTQLDADEQRIACLEERDCVLVSRHKELEFEVSKLQKELRDARDSHKIASYDLQQEKESKELLRNMLQTVRFKNRELEDDLDAAKLSIVALQRDVLGGQDRISNLVNQVSNLLEEKTNLENIKTALENELKKLKAGSEDELAELSEKVRLLESGLEKAKEEASHSDKKVHQLKKDLREVKVVLERKSKHARFALPAAVVSVHILAVVGLLAFTRRARNQ